MAIYADRDDIEPDEELDEEAEKRAANEGMLAPEEDSGTWGELESEKLDDGDAGSNATGQDK